MAGRASLNAKNLEALGPARLAALLLQHTEGNTAARRALRLALAEQQGPLEMAQEVRKRLAAVERSSSWLDQKRRDALLADLERQRQAIAGPIAAHDPDLAKSLGDRCDCFEEGVVFGREPTELRSQIRLSPPPDQAAPPRPAPPWPW
jgi:hypothetical protein